MKAPILVALLLSLSTLQLRAEEEVAIILRNDAESHYNELEFLNRELRALQGRFEMLDSKLEEMSGSELQQMKSSLGALQIQMTTIRTQIAAIPTQDDQVAFRNKNKQVTAPTPAPVQDDCCSSSCRCDKPEPKCYLEKEASCARWGISLGGDWLYWQAKQAGMQYATTYRALPGVMSEAHTEVLDFEMGSGWRVFGKADIPYDGWDFFVAYTQISPSANSSVSGVLYPYLMCQNDSFSSTTFVNQAKARWGIELKAVDFEIGHELLLCKSFMFRPFMGAKGAWIDQNANINYIGTPTSPSNQYNISIGSDFGGGGLRMGFDSVWKWAAGFSLFGDAAASLLWGSYDLDQTQTLLGIPDVQWNDHLHGMAPVVEAKLGVSWDWDSFCGKYHIGLDAALEMQYWWQQNIYERFTSGSVTGTVLSTKQAYDLGFVGLTLGGRFGF